MILQMKAMGLLYEVKSRLYCKKERARLKRQLEVGFLWSEKYGFKRDTDEFTAH